MTTLTAAAMACVIPCAGEGVRLRPLTLHRSKQLLPVCNRPVVDHVLSAVSEAGLRSAALIVSPDPAGLRDYVGDGSRWGLRVQWIVQPQPRGIAHAVLLAEEYAAGRPLIVYLGDNLFSDGIAAFVRRFAEVHPSGLLRLRRVEDPRRYGVAMVEDGRVQRVVEKPAEPPSDLAITGLYGLPSEFFEAIRRTKPSARGELEITDAISGFMATPPGVRAELWDGFWADTGETQSLLRANRALLETVGPGTGGADIRTSAVTGRVAVGAGTLVDEGSEVIGPVAIGRCCRVIGSQIGPYVALGDGAVVEGSRVRESVLDAGAAVRGQRAWLEQSILGLRAEVVGRGEDGPPVTLVLGDDVCEREP
jgi:glucose-1-phosphate thymidylyltransferase